MQLIASIQNYFFMRHLLFFITLWGSFALANVAFAQTTGNKKVIAKKSAAATATTTVTQAAPSVDAANDNKATSLPECDILYPQKILRLQIALKAAGYDPNAADNILGPSTRHAILQFQKDHNLPVGNLNLPTLEALDRVLVEKGLCKIGN